MEDPALPPGTRVVHIGPQKTGSTALQSALHGARDELAAANVYLPRGGLRRREAGWALGLMGRWLGAPMPPIERWTELTDEIAENTGDGIAIISNEDFGRADDAIARRIVEGLGGDQVHVVAVARRLDLLLPSQWQERVKGGIEKGYHPWLRAVLSRDPSRYEARNVWSGHDLPALAHRWSELAPGRFTLLVPPPGDAAFLPRSFERLLGLADGVLAPGEQTNRGLSWPETETIRAVNKAFRLREWDTATRIEFLRAGVFPALSELPPTAGIPSHPPLPTWAADEVARLADEHITALSAAPIHIIGDLEDLRPPVASGDAEPRAGSLVPVASAAMMVEALVAAALRAREQPAPERRRVRYLRRLAHLGRRTGG